MAAVNRVFLMGNLTRDPELRKTPSGMSVSDLGLAVSEKYKNKEGKVVESTCFADIVVWGRQAETCCEFLTKGSQVMVEGQLQLDQWQTDNGEKRTRMRIRADRVQFLGRPKKQGDKSASNGDSQPSSAPTMGDAPEDLF